MSSIQNWKSIKLKYLADLRSGESITSDVIEPTGLYPVYGGGALRGYTSEYTHEGKYILIGRQGAHCGNVKTVHGKLWASEHAVVVTPNLIVDIEWLGYLLESMNLNQYSMSAAQPGLAVSMIKNLDVPFIPKKTQEKIAKYINAKVSSLEELIEQKEKLIQLLEEKRQSMITEAVTKGLNSNVKMKASGIEWIDGIPEHWVVKRVKHIAAKGKYSLVDGPFGSDLKNEEYKDEGVPLIQLNNIRNGEHLFNNIKYVTEEKARNLGKHTAAPGDLVVAKMAYPVGRSAIVSPLFQKYVIVADCIKLSLDENYCNKFINYALNTQYFISQAELVAGGITRIRINLGELKQLKVFIPPYQEQLLICEYLDEKVKEIDNCTELVKDQIQKLKEYRQSLIYEAVTGKIDVREFETVQ